jgi:glycosyltransferase involved in cell wall biosynthesis
MAAASAIAINRRLGTWVNQVDRFVVATKFLEDILVRTGLPADRMRRIPLSAPDPGERQEPPSSSRTVLLVGRLDPEKGVREFLETWRSSGSDLELAVIGDGVERAVLEEMAVPNVRFLGWMDPANVRQQMLAARALVFPSQMMETFGLGIVESFAAGMPAIANDMGTRPDVMGRDGAGWLVSSRQEWHAALAAIADDSTVDAAGAAARDRYLTRFHPEVTLPQLVSVYRELDTTSVPAGG